MNKICYGCGVKLQCETKEKEGYIPKEKIDSAEYCQNCFRLIHYGEVPSTGKVRDNKSVIKSVNEKAKFVVFLMDFIDIFKESINLYKSIKVKKILVISKSDIIPKSISYDKIKTYLKKVYGVNEEIVFVNNKSNLNKFLNIISKEKEIYFLGLTNAGKSTLINSLINADEGKNAFLTTSYKENTTKDFVRLNILGMKIVDSPGFILPNFELDKYSNIKEEINPITYQNKTACTYNLGDILSIRFLNKSNLVFYFSNNLSIKREYNKEIIGFKLRVSKNSDIVICNLGFIRVTEDVEIILSSELMKYINIRPSLVVSYE